MTNEGTYYGGGPPFIKYIIALFHFTITLMGSVVSFDFRIFTIIVIVVVKLKQMLFIFS